jgi:hypothetical protein
MFNVVLKCILQILKEGALFGELNNLFMKIAFLNATSSPKQIGPAGLFSPAESEIWPADQTGKLRTGMHLTCIKKVTKLVPFHMQRSSYIYKYMIQIELD